MKNINGIGEKTLKDIKRVYSSVDELIIGLEGDSVSLRDDIVYTLKKVLMGDK